MSFVVKRVWALDMKIWAEGRDYLKWHFFRSDLTKLSSWTKPKEEEQSVNSQGMFEAYVPIAIWSKRRRMSES